MVFWKISKIIFLEWCMDWLESQCFCCAQLHDLGQSCRDCLTSPDPSQVSTRTNLHGWHVDICRQVIITVKGSYWKGCMGHKIICVCSIFYISTNREFPFPAQGWWSGFGTSWFLWCLSIHLRWTIESLGPRFAVSEPGVPELGGVPYLSSPVTVGGEKLSASVKRSQAPSCVVFHFCQGDSYWAAPDMASTFLTFRILSPYGLVEL